MENQDVKCVVVVDDTLPTGIIANTAAILGITLGRYIPEVVGEDVTDSSGSVHKGIIFVPVPILKAGRGAIKALREKLLTPYFNELFVADFSDVAQNCYVYDEYVKKTAATKEEDYIYLGLAIFGNKKKINKLTGNLFLLR